MADAKITALTALVTAATEDLLAIVDDPSGTPVTKKITLANLITSLLVSNVVVQTKTAGSDTYTPTSGMKKVLVICVGGGGGTPAETVADAAISGGGGGGAAIKLFDAATIGASQAYTVAATSTSGGNTSGLGTANALLQATGGEIGASTGLATAAMVRGGGGGVGTNGDLNLKGAGGGPGITTTTAIGCGGNGGDSLCGGGGRGGINTEEGEAGGDFGGGAGGGHTSAGTDLAAVAGAAGVMYFIEFLA